MVLNDRIAFLENWYFLVWLLQVFLLGLVHYRIGGSWAALLLSSGRNAGFRSGQAFDKVSILSLFINLGLGIALFLTNYLVATFYLKTAFWIALCISIVVLLLWHLDYFFLWFFLHKVTLKTLQDGNVGLYFFSVLTVGINFLQIFLDPSITVLWILVGLFIVIFCVRFWTIGFGFLKTGFLWYYFILYFCTVYVVPSALLSKYYNPQWLELLTP